MRPLNDLEQLIRNAQSVNFVLSTAEIERYANMSTASTLLLLLSVILCTNILFYCCAQNALIFGTTPPPPAALIPAVTTAQSILPPRWVLVNNEPIIANMAPFVTQPPPTQEFLDCFGRCPTTSQYNPICGSNRQLYLNEQKFNCARACGADIQIVRRGSCEGLFQMQRG